MKYAAYIYNFRAKPIGHLDRRSVSSTAWSATVALCALEVSAQTPGDPVKLLGASLEKGAKEAVHEGWGSREGRGKSGQEGVGLSSSSRVPDLTPLSPPRPALSVSSELHPLKRRHSSEETQ